MFSLEVQVVVKFSAAAAYQKMNSGGGLAKYGRRWLKVALEPNTNITIKYIFFKSSKKNMLFYFIEISNKKVEIIIILHKYKMFGS